MPYTLRIKPGPKTHKRRCYQVMNKKKRLFSKCTSKKNATRQLRLLRAIQYNKNFVPRRMMK